MDLTRLRDRIIEKANLLGFNPVGIAPALPVPQYPIFQTWLDQGYYGEMHYLAREDTVAKRADPRLILEDCRRIISLAMPYKPPQTSLEPAPQGKGRISAYAATRDYHQIIWEKLARLETFIRCETREELPLKFYVDTGPILERAYALTAGLGAIGKNSNLLIQGTGSYFFLAEILTDLPLPVDPPYTRDLCGSCRRCIDACPTGCILPNRTIDATRCISYLTIENKGAIPDILKSQLGDWIFGCDVCQIVCPHNSRATEKNKTLEARLLPEFMDLIDLFSYDEAMFTAQFGETPLSRTGRRGILRNAALVLGNQQMKSALPTLQAALAQETDPVIQDACRWAIGEIETANREKP